MGDKKDFEKKVDGVYRRYRAVAERYGFTFRRNAVTAGGVPCALFLGNHSAGKSSLVNWIVGGSEVQDTGVAPTDDGFTVLMHGDVDEDVFGPAALDRLPAEFRALEALGPGFLQHFKVKTRNRDILRGLWLVDSPGMIDAADGTVERDYDFAEAVRRLAELCDMVFFLFDPEKPGTTGETVNVFAKSLSGVEFKLRVLFNKCDLLDRAYDFARAYSTLCWNLARVLKTKDMPKIYTVYSGSEKVGKGGFDFEDFNRQRKELLGVLSDASARRMDNVYAAAHADFSGLSIRMRMLNRAWRKLAACRFYTIAGGMLAMAAAFAVSLLAFGADAGAGASGRFGVLAWALAVIASAFAGMVAWLVDRLSLKLLRAKLARDIDDAFEDEYRMELLPGTHDDLRQRWEEVKPQTIEMIAGSPLKLPLFGEHLRRRLDALANF